jgi:formylglycine-generating enzyme required for sulfatase activity
VSAAGRRGCCAPSGAAAPAGGGRAGPTAQADRLEALAAAATAPPRARLAGGRFRMGSDRPTFPEDGEGPAREVGVAGFAIDAWAIDNARFAAFVRATGHVTDAERRGASFVFHGLLAAGVEGRPVPGLPWWRWVEGACWRMPEGPGSDVTDRARHPAVHLSWRDARAFAAWAGGRLPSEAEWEYAARGGLEGARFPWGDELEPDGQHRCNVWQGPFPQRDLGLDGFRGTAPVDAFAPNGFGLFCVVGNVWEWCADRFAGRGPDQRVQKGGSYLCHASYCDRYRPAARSAAAETDAFGHAGARVAYDA